MLRLISHKPLRNLSPGFQPTGDRHENKHNYLDTAMFYKKLKTFNIEISVDFRKTESERRPLGRPTGKTTVRQFCIRSPTKSSYGSSRYVLDLNISMVEHV